MIVNLKEILDIADRQFMAVGAFNVPHLESLRATIGAAEQLNLPVIVQFAQVHESWTPIEYMAPVMIKAASEAKVPVCVYLDHGETLEYVQKALDLGFTSVMYDGSVLPFEENIANTKKAVAMANVHGASVEAELGSMGKRESGSGDSGGADDNAKKVYTDPQQARQFVTETGITALACSFGTTHGLYKAAPQLNFDIVRDVRRLADNIPVVMHGGSGVSPKDYRKAVAAGVRKINYFTYMDKAGGTAMAGYLESLKSDDPKFFTPISLAGLDAMQKNVGEAMKVFALQG
ncbi:MAG: class II fructose-bisphosphate aldolase [Eubacterium sp.]|nr:class II fructose-bisphosphate aldolase [Eubacterium sp.]